ncbi:MAG TPA: hypothetical protein PKI03_23655, partial [Pseudomonadota bacterium]|nr:hypothetical protein [Pseudomonadota bacterium]
MSDRKIAAALYLGCVLVYALIAGQRLLAPSNDTHFVYQAQSFLQRRLDLGRTPPHDNDWAMVETLTLRDGSKLEGQFLRQTPDRFRLLSGRTRVVSPTEISERSRKYYVSFPPFPAVVMLPFVAIFGPRTNDVVFTVLLAGLVPALLFLLLRRLPAHLAGPAFPDAAAEGPPGVESFDLGASLWLTALFAFGSVFFFSSVLGQVWFTAHIVSLVLCGLYLHALYAPLRPIVAGLCLAGMFLTRPQMAALLPLFVLEVLRRHHPRSRYPRSLGEAWAILWGRPLPVTAGAEDAHREDGRPVADDPAAGPLRRQGSPWPALISFAVASGFLALLGLVHNYLRFGRALEFGHSYLTTMQADNIQRFGLINYQYLSRNLATALTLLPKLLPAAPYVQISYHGLALWFTTPALLFLLWPEPTAALLDAMSDRVPPTYAATYQANAQVLRIALALCCVPIAGFALLYQNTGYVQFGYRFSLDYMLPLVFLLALTQGRRLREPGSPLGRL